MSVLFWREPLGIFDPYRNYQFLVEFDGIVVAGFSEVEGLEIQVEVEEIKEGGVNDHVHKLPKGGKFPNLVLKRGLTDIDSLYRWQQDVLEGKVKRSNIWIVLLTPERVPGWVWMAKDAYPVKWNGPSLNANQGAIAVESLELAHNGLAKYSWMDLLRKAKNLL
ncbi:MAG: phage tail protein [Methanotrichaceae archaeon]|nr:phage tail protein [Methanotrichaceae archaeon]